MSLHEIDISSTEAEEQSHAALVPKKERGETAPQLNEAAETPRQEVPAPVVGRPKRRYIAGALVVAVAAAAVAPEAWHVVRVVTSNSYSAQVSSYGLVPLNFQQVGILSSLDVAVGQHVRQGEILANESAVVSTAVLARDKAAVAADEKRLQVLQSLYTGVSGGSPAAVASSYKSEISAANAALTAAQTAFAPELASANAQVSALQEQYSTVDGVFQQQCPGGPDSPGPNFSLEQCVQLYDSVQSIQQSANSAKQLVLSLEAQQTIAIASAQKALTDAQDASTIAAQGPSSAYTYGVDLSSAQSQLAKDQAQLQSDETLAGASVLTSPYAGVVAEIDGVVGQQVSPSGVSAVLPQGGVSQSQASTGFLATQSLSQTSVSASAPLLVLRTNSPMRITALVPQTSIRNVHVGSLAEFTPQVKGLRPLRVRVLQIGAFPVIASGTAEYSVTLVADNQASPGYMQGIVGSLRFS